MPRIDKKINNEIARSRNYLHYFLDFLEDRLTCRFQIAIQIDETLPYQS